MDMVGLFLHKWTKNTPEQCLVTLIAAAIQKPLLHFKQRNPEKLVVLKCYLKTWGLDTDPHKLFRSRLSRLYQFSPTLWLPTTIILSCFYPTAKRHRKLIKVLQRGMPYIDDHCLFPSPGCRQTPLNSVYPWQNLARGFSFWHFMLWRSFFAC